MQLPPILSANPKTGEMQPVIWAHKSYRASVMGKVPLVGVLPFLLLFMVPKFWMFMLVLLNLVSEIVKQKYRAERWADVGRRIRFSLVAGYWRCQRRHATRQVMRAWGNYSNYYY